MSKICLYLDEDTMASSLVKALRFRNVDVITVTDTHREELTDKEQLEWAFLQRRVICSCNVGEFVQLPGLYPSLDSADDRKRIPF
jgi:membrane glycosyltransferase